MEEQNTATTSAPVQPIVICPSPRLKVLEKQCRNRGGNCDCQWKCAGVTAATESLETLCRSVAEAQREIDRLEKVCKRLQTPPATLREGFTFREGLTPVMVFDGGDEANFGYEDAEGEWIESGEWPFNEEYVWFDDCERFGIRVE